MKEFLLQNKKWFLFGLVVHLLAAFFSVGHLHPDEHFQILEFLGLKLGTTPENALPWEYSSKMRPWIQPGFYYLLVKFWHFLGIEDRFFWTCSLRIISSLAGFISIFLLAYSSAPLLKKPWQKKWHILLLNTLWFLPFIHARISSEGMGSSFFTIPFSFLLLCFYQPNFKTNRKLFAISLLFGVAFLFRYHIGFMILPLITWGVIEKKISLHEFFIISFGIFTTILLGVLIDYWGYGTWSFAPYQYLYENIIQDKASGYGVSPWWDYFKLIHKKAIPPYGILIIITFLFMWIKGRKNIFTWASLPFFIIHSAIGHKELRFLFPIAIIAPYAFLYSLGAVEEEVKRYPIFKKWGRPFAINFLFPIMLILLLGSSIKSVHPSYSFFTFTKDYSEKITHLKYLANESPYNLYKLEQHFYRSHTPKLEKIETFEEVKEEGIFWLFTDRYNNFLLVKKNLSCDILYTNYPDWFLNNFGPILKRSKMWALYKCKS